MYEFKPNMPAENPNIHFSDSSHATDLPKLIVFDLDGVLWSGMISDASTAIHIDCDFAQLLPALDQRGVLLSCISKNHKDNVMSELREHCLDHYFVAIEATIGPKAMQLTALLQILSIRPDDVLFIDDSLEERNDILMAFPTIRTLAPETAKSFLHCALQEKPDHGTTESRMRKDHYFREFERHVRNPMALAEVSSFIASSALTVYINDTIYSELPRIVDLYERAHRLNFANRAQSFPSLQQMLLDTDRIMWTLRVVDRYGPYGVVGSILGHRKDNRFIIEDFVISCRVQGRMVEHAIIRAIIGYAKAVGIDTINISFHPNRYNDHLKEVIALFGFRLSQNSDSLWSLCLSGGTGDEFLSGVILPLTIWEDGQDDNSYGGVPFVRNTIKRWSQSHAFYSPIASVGAGYDEVIGSRWETLLGDLSSANVTTIDQCEDTGADLVANAETLDGIDDGVYATVVCIDVLEHASRPWLIPSAILRILKEGGYVILSIPCIYGVHYSPNDLWRLTPAGLEYIVSQAANEDCRNSRLVIEDLVVEGFMGYPIRTMLLARKMSINNIEPSFFRI